MINAQTRKLDCLVAFAPRNDARHTSAFSPRDAPEWCKNCSPKTMEGAGNAGCALHPQSHVQNKKAHEVVTTGSPEQSGIPHAMVLTAYSALSPVIGLSCHRRKRDTSR
jgi:hypothetical protein